MDQRLEEIESKLLHLEMAYEELNQVVYKQARELDIAQRQIKTLQARIKEMLEQVGEQPFSPEDERPPHY